MSVLTYLPHQPNQVLDALREGQVSAIEIATEQVPDFFLLYAVESGLLEELAKSFPDPRKQQPEISLYILLAAGIAWHFAGLYALSQMPYALHSPQLLTTLGVQVVVNRPGKGLSRKGTKEPVCFHGDVVRKLLEQIAATDKKAGRLPGQRLLDWYNQHVGHLFCRAADAQPCVHILDCTDLTVSLENENYEHSGVTTKNGKPERGYKLATLRSLLDAGAVLTAIGWGQIQDHDLTLTHEMVRTCPHLRPGDMLVEDRGFLDASNITYLKKERQVDVCTGLKRDMLLLRGAIVQAQARPGAWQPHPTRRGQQIQRVAGISSLWEGLGVPMNVCVVRFKDKKTGQWDCLGFATTDLSLSARQIIQTYQTRPEIEEDYRQLKSPSWRISSFLTTRLVQILWHVLLTLLAYNLFQVYANTEAGRAFAGKTKQKIEREQMRHAKVYFLVCTACAFGVFEAKELLGLMLLLPQGVRETLSALLQVKRE
jgi:Transposase DDE domain